MMQPNFEIKYLELKWYDQDTLTKVTESLCPLRIDYDNVKNTYQADTTIFPRLSGIERGHLAIRYLDNTKTPPYIKLANGDVLHFMAIQDPDTNITWWIVQELWSDENKQWQGIAHNIAGTVRIFLQTVICELNISGFDFTREELEQYLQTFKNDLWELILDENSPAQAEAKQTLALTVNEKVIDCIHSIVSSAEKILLNPKVELREIQELKPRKSVKPVNRTFMELATKSNQRLLTSRSTIPSYDVPENRYILFALQRCYRIIRQVVILAKNKSNRYLDTIDKLQAQHDSFSDTVKINKNLVLADLNKIYQRTRFEYWQEIFNNKLRKSNICFSSKAYTEDLFFSIESYTTDKRTKKPDGFFVQSWINNSWEKAFHKSNILKFNNNLSELVEIIEPNTIIKINCQYNTNQTERAYTYFVNEIHSITLWNAEEVTNKALRSYNKEAQIVEQLEKNNWQKKLSSSELEEQNKEKNSLTNRIEFYTEHQKNAFYVYEKVEPKLRLLKHLIKELIELEVKASSYFPNSMTFVQNPHYQGVHNNYKLLREITNLADDDLLLSLEQIDEIGLINMPILYERWVLIQLILVLSRSFRFISQENWKYQLINSIKSNQKNIKINMLNIPAKRMIDLWYEKELDNKNRPDFVLDLKWRPKHSNKGMPLSEKRFVLDAKFYDKSTFNRNGGLIAKINKLYYDKGYSESASNPVFLIHPCPTAIEQQITAQDWGKHSFLGEIGLSEELHNKGAIFLSPISNTLHNDELQRLLGLFLQYKLEPSETYCNETDVSTATPLCIRCGSSNITEVEKPSTYTDKQGRQRERTDRSVWLQCNECQQIQIYNHCGDKNCDTRLIKNGLYWSYHSARALEPFNMKCPKCGEWGAW